MLLVTCGRITHIDKFCCERDECRYSEDGVKPLVVETKLDLTQNLYTHIEVRASLSAENNELL